MLSMIFTKVPFKQRIAVTFALQTFKFDGCNPNATDRIRSYSVWYEIYFKGTPSEIKYISITYLNKNYDISVWIALKRVSHINQRCDKIIFSYL